MWEAVLILCVITFLMQYYGRSNTFIRIRMYIDSFILFMSFSMLFLFWPYLLWNPRSTKNGKITDCKKAAHNNSDQPQTGRLTDEQDKNILVKECIDYVTSSKRFCSRIIRYAAMCTNFKWELRNSHILAEDRAAIIVSNHQSSLDIVGSIIIWNICDKLTIIAKKELLYFFNFGITFYLCGIVFIDRKDAKNAYKELINTVKKLKESKTKVWIYPEGTRNKDLTKLLPFKRGAFTTAIEAQIPIIPVVFSPYHFKTEGNESLLLQGPIVMECLEPVQTEGLVVDDAPALAERVRERMEAKYKQLSEEVLRYSTRSDREHSCRPLLEIKN